MCHSAVEIFDSIAHAAITSRCRIQTSVHNLYTHAAGVGSHLHNVRLDLFIDAVFRGDEDDRHQIIDQCDGSVFHFCSGVPLRVNVADLLHLEGPLQGYGVVVAPAEEETVVRVAIDLTSKEL
jgi:hypothetical protein